MLRSETRVSASACVEERRSTALESQEKVEVGSEADLRVLRRWRRSSSKDRERRASVLEEEGVFFPAKRKGKADG